MRAVPEGAAEGGCACGAVRYVLASAPYDAGYCHCRICQLSSGAPVMAFATVPLGDLVMVKGEPRKRRSSNFGERWFCGQCGTPIAMRVDHQPDTIDFTLATLDAPDALMPGFHIWTQSRIGWFDTADRLPRHERFRPDTVGMDATVAAGAPARPAGRIKLGRDMMTEEERPAHPGDDRRMNRPDTRRIEPDPAAKRIERGEPRRDEVNPLAPPINIESGG